MKTTQGPETERNGLRRGIYILPNIFTSVNLFCGFYAIVMAIEGAFLKAATLILIAGIFDLLDGKIARATNTSSQFGIEYDSLADLISFGLAPAILVYLWALRPLGQVGWLTGFLFAACGALRLARFNTQTGQIGSQHFVGLPIPAGAGMTACTVLFLDRLGIAGADYSFIILTMVYVLSFLMVSTLKYQSFKTLDLRSRTHFQVIVAMLLIAIFIASQFAIAVFFLGLIYVLSAPVYHFQRSHLIRERLGRQAERKASKLEQS